MQGKAEFVVPLCPSGLAVSNRRPGRSAQPDARSDIRTSRSQLTLVFLVGKIERLAD